MSELLHIPVGLASTPGKGTVFYAEMSPATPQQRTPTSKSKKPDQKFSLHGKLVWIIDNDPQVLNATRDLFQSWGARVVTAKDAQDIIQQREEADITDLKPDLLLVDYHLDNNKTGNVEAKILFDHLGEQIPTNSEQR